MQWERKLFSLMMHSMWLRAALPWCLLTSSVATTHCYDTEVSLTLELGFLTCTCSIKFRIWESGSACTPRNVPKTSSFLWKVKEIWLSNDNHMHRVVQAHWKERRRVDVRHCCLTQGLHSCGSDEKHFCYMCTI